MTKKQKVEVACVKYSDGWCWQCKIGNVSLNSEPYSSEAAAVRGVLVFFARYVLGKTPVIEEGG